MATGSSALRVLVVDDEPLMRWAIAETLTALGYSVVEAEDGQSAVRTLAEAPKPIDVIVLDCRLPDSDDLALLATIRSLAPASQVIVMTAYGTSDITKRALDLGAYGVMSKPFEMRQIAGMVQEAHAARPH